MPIIVESVTTDIITLDEAKSFLNITSTASDAELADFISAASAAWVSRVGPVAGSPEYSEWYDGGRPEIVLRHTPVQAVTSVTEAYTSSLEYVLNPEVLDGSGGGAWGYTVDLSAGVVIRRATGVAVPFASGRRNVHVVYTAGYAAVPADVQHAVKLLLRHMWETQRGGFLTSSGEAEFAPGISYTWPRRVEEIAAAYIVPGIA